MLLRHFVLYSLFIFSSTAFADCGANSQILGAVYEAVNIPNGEQDQKRRQVILWRNGQQVAHEYKDTHIAELWEKTKTGMLRLERYFDEHKRGIEYQPSDINSGRGTTDWSLRNQLISNELLGSMQLTETKGKDCDVLEKYFFSDDNVSIELDWLPELALIKNYSEESKAGKIQWKLQQVILDEERVKKAFRIRSNYQTTDYADIGDNESDPFLMKMINLGHLNHSHSGFYNDQGQAFSGHSHNH